MTATKRHRLEVGEDPRFQEMSWKMQRVGFVLLLVFVAAGALGVFGGGGPLARGVADSQGVSVVFERFLRFDTQTGFEIAIPPGSEGPFVVELRGDLASALRIEQIFPPPRSVSVRPDADRYAFEAPGAKGGIVTLSASPTRIGPLVGEIRIGGAVVPLRQFVHP